MLTLLLAVALVLLCAPAANAAEGSCGENLTWKLEGGTLTISGSGPMTNYSESSPAPWSGYRDQITALSLDNGLTAIGSRAFYALPNLLSATIPASVQSIGEAAFCNNTSLTMLSLRDGLETIGRSAFEGCASLQEVRIPGTVTRIDGHAFYFCESLTYASIPASAKTLGSGMFSYCKNLLRVDIETALENVPGWTFHGCDSLSSLNVQGTPVNAEVKKVPADPGPIQTSQSGQNTNQEAAAGTDGSTYMPPSDSSGGDSYTPPSDGNGGGSYTSPDDGNGGTTDIPPAGGNGAGNDAVINGSTVTTENSTGSDGTTTTTSTHQNTNGSSTSTTTTVQNSEDTTMTSTNTVSTAQNGDAHVDTEIQATVWKEAGWNEVLKKLDQMELLHKMANTSSAIILSVNLPDSNVVPKKVLQALTGRDVVLHIRTGAGSQFTLNFKTLGQIKIDSDLDLSYTLEVTEDVPEMLSGCTVYRLSFHNSASILAEIIIRLPGGHVRQTASLYQIEKGDGLNLLQSVMVDDEGNAHWYLKSVDHKTEYLIGMNVPGANPSQAIIPEVLYDEYKVANVYDGVEYVVTGRTSSWNMGLGQVMGILAAVMVTVIVGVGVFMYMLNKRKLAMGYIPELDDEDFM